MSLRVDKHKREVELYVDGRPAIRGFVFLKQNGERVLDLLTEGDSFFPFEAKTGEFSVIRKSSVRKLAVNAEFELAHLLKKKHHILDVALTLTDGTEERGRLFIQPNQDAARLSDEINREKGFLLLDCGSTAHLVGSPYIATVREISRQAPTDLE